METLNNYVLYFLYCINVTHMVIFFFKLNAYLDILGVSTLQNHI